MRKKKIVKKTLLERLWFWLSLALSFILILVINEYAHMMSSPVNGALQIVITFVVIIYTYYSVKVIYNLFKNNLFKNKKL